MIKTKRYNYHEFGDKEYYRVYNILKSLLPLHYTGPVFFRNKKSGNTYEILLDNFLWPILYDREKHIFIPTNRYSLEKNSWEFLPNGEIEVKEIEWI